MNINDDATRALNWARDSKVLGFDVETTGLDWRKDHVIGFAIGIDNDAVYIPVAHGGGGNLVKFKAFITDLNEAISRRTGRQIIVGHNLMFDMNMCCASYGMVVPKYVYCTMNAQALINEYTPNFSLEALGEYYDVETKKSVGMYQYLADKFKVPATKKAMSVFWQLSGIDPMVQEYAKSDVLATLQVYKHQLKEIQDQDLTAIVALENRLLPTLVRMEQKGVAIDENKLGQLDAQVELEIQDAERKLPPDLNPRSSTAMHNYIAGVVGRFDYPLTDKGNPSYPEAYLDTFPEGQLIVDLRKWKNLKNTFIQPLIDRHIFQGRVHPRLNPNTNGDHGTISGRLSGSNPNFQQIPKRDKKRARLFRSVFVADEGHNIHDDDWVQCEPKLFAHYAEDPALIAGYNADPIKDVHSIVAEMLNVDRQFGKTLNMGIFNGMRTATLARYLGVGLQESQSYLDRWDQLFPSIKIFRRQAAQVLKNRGYIVTLLGRRCRLEHPRFAYKAVSKIIQGGNADIMKLKLIEIDNLFESEGQGNLISSVHDSIVYQAPSDVTSLPVLREIEHIMCDVQGPPINLNIPFTIDRGAGASWAEASFGEEHD